MDWRSVRSALVDRFANGDFTDVRVNTGFVVLGLLTGADFEERILICNNCGFDTDSTTASLGALLGIMDPLGIPERWSSPIGETLVLRPEIRGVVAPPTLTAFTDLVLQLEREIGRVEPHWASLHAGRTRPARGGSGVHRQVSPARLDHACIHAAGRWTFAAEAPRAASFPGTWHRLARKAFEEQTFS